tara:strand:- start:85 stop:534 length:450 start_codon:yes stop_codon:yes gene_type:complete
MADKKISELTTATTLTGAEQIPLVQSTTTKKTTVADITNKLIVVSKTATASEAVDLSGSTYTNAHLIKLTWSGGAGTAVYTLPTASSSTNRILRFISDSTFASNTHVDVTPASSDNLDGSTDAYRINKAFEGVAIWSDGTEWFIIQKKA